MSNRRKLNRRQTKDQPIVESIPTKKEKVENRGRPYVFNEINKDKIISALRNGMPQVKAIKRANISTQTFFNWVNRGKEDRENKRQSDYTRFLDRVERARADGEASYLEIINSVARGGGGRLVKTVRRKFHKDTGILTEESIREEEQGPNWQAAAWAAERIFGYWRDRPDSNKDPKETAADIKRELDALKGTVPPPPGMENLDKDPTDESIPIEEKLPDNKPAPIEHKEVPVQQIPDEQKLKSISAKGEDQEHKSNGWTGPKLKRDIKINGKKDKKLPAKEDYGRPTGRIIRG